MPPLLNYNNRVRFAYYKIESPVKIILAVLVVLVVLVSAGGAWAALADGEKMVRDPWQLFASKQWDKVEAMMSPAF